MLTPELIAQEKRHDKISAISTTIIMVIFLLLTLIWTAYRQRVPPPGEKEYEMLGAIDFGDYKQGSRQVNNFQKAVADPNPQPQQQQAKAVQEAEVSDQTPTPTPPVVTKAPSPVIQPDPPVVKKQDPKPTPPKTQTPKEDKKADEKSNDNNNSNTTSEEPELTFNNTTNESGSNHGTSDDGIGNSGTPNVKVLDPKGLYTFGTGSEGGLKGRSVIALSEPQYTVQEEGDLKFEFVIEPDGSVSYVKLVGLTDKPGLKQAGINAIRKWRFSKLTAAQGNQRQTVQVTIKFRLKG
ncbi:MAG: TonB family protein [Bacteroidetes bacterium]|nr:TonB family protein [Bacteroidota bacterium]MCB0841683.1 TonB family protein [Bacteroidota bacterium]